MITNKSQRKWTDECDVALFVALREELQAVDIFSDGSNNPITNDLNLEIQQRQLLDPKNRDLRVLTVLLDDQGPESAAIATTKFLERVKTKLLVLVGISGRVSSDCRLADVVLATTCDNSYFRAKKQQGAVLPGGKEWPLDPLASQLAAELAASPPYLSYAGIAPDSLARLRETSLVRDVPLVLAGPIATTPFVVDSPDFSDWLSKSRNRNILATDMESAAVVQAAHACGVRNGRVLVCRGISDPADGTKADTDAVGRGAIRRAAIQNAAQLVSHALSKLLTLSDERILFRQSEEGMDDQFSSFSDVIDYLRDLTDAVESSRLNEQQAHIALSTKVRGNGPLVRQLNELARAAYRLGVEQKETPGHSVLYRLPSTALDYLAAKWIMDSLASDETTQEVLGVLSNVYPQRINRFCKAFLSALPDEKRILDGLIRAYELKPRAKRHAQVDTHERAKAHICYLMGRLQSPQHRTRAADALRRWRNALYPSSLSTKLDADTPPRLERLFGALETPERRLLLRTICISLILLDQQGEADAYIRACLRSKEFDSLNRGFHLEYYGDIDYDPTQSMNNVDPVKVSPTKTFAVLHRKLYESYAKDNPYPLRDVELQTLLSLAQHRHAVGVLDNEKRVKLVQFLDRWPADRLTTNRLLQGFIEMLRPRLAEARMWRADLLRKLLELKKVRRSGWNDTNQRHKRSTPDPESVLSHTAGGLLLIHFCLPERLSREDRKKLGDEQSKAYSKEEVAKIFFVHDLAEAHIGDLLPSERNDETKSEEQRINSQIDLYCTWRDFYFFGMYRAWNDFENGITINGRIAREIDALENLIQLTIEAQNEGVVISDADSWRDELIRRVNTPIGKRILEMILEK